MRAAVTRRDASHCRAGSTAGAKRECQVANSVRPARAADAIKGSSSLTLAPGGFSSITCLPAASAAAAWARRTCGGVQRATASIGGPSRNNSSSVAKCGKSGSEALRLATAASVTPGVAAMAGTC
jgi:hypothetical protein